MYIWPLIITCCHVRCCWGVLKTKIPKTPKTPKTSKTLKLENKDPPYFGGAPKLPPAGR